MERREHDVAAVGRAHGGFGGDRVSDFADHDHVGRLPQHAPEQLGEADLDLGIDLRLPDPGIAYSIGSSIVLIFRSPLLRCLRQA